MEDDGRRYIFKLRQGIKFQDGSDFDANAAAAILDPQKANDDRYYSFYGKTSAGPYTVTSALGLRMRIDQMTIDGVGARPSRLQLPAPSLRSERSRQKAMGWTDGDRKAQLVQNGCG